MSYFEAQEFLCRCGRRECDAAQKPHATLLTMLNIMRSLYGGPLVITSGNRCRAWNAEQGGADPSEHTAAGGCLGVDLACATSRERFRMTEAARHAGFKRIGVYPKHLHVGMGELVAHVTFPSDVEWIGGYKQAG